MAHTVRSRGLLVKDAGGKEKAGLEGPATLLEGSATDIVNWEGYYPE